MNSVNKIFIPFLYVTNLKKTRQLFLIEWTLNLNFLVFVMKKKKNLEYKHFIAENSGINIILVITGK